MINYRANSWVFYGKEIAPTTEAPHLQGYFRGKMKRPHVST